MDVRCFSSSGAASLSSFPSTPAGPTHPVNPNVGTQRRLPGRRDSGIVVRSCSEGVGGGFERILAVGGNLGRRKGRLENGVRL